MKPATSLDFEELVERYYQPVFTFAVKLCGKLDRALELTQHTFCLALNRGSYLAQAQSAKGWLFTLLFREFLTEESLKREPRSSFAPRRHSSKPGSATPILAALTKLREELQTPLILFYAKDFSFSQIADYLGISIEAVLTLLSEGREKFSRAIAPQVSRGRIRRPEMVSLAA